MKYLIIISLFTHILACDTKKFNQATSILKSTKRKMDAYIRDVNKLGETKETDPKKVCKIYSKAKRSIYNIKEKLYKVKSPLVDSVNDFQLLRSTCVKKNYDKAVQNHKIAESYMRKARKLYQQIDYKEDFLLRELSKCQ